MNCASAPRLSGARAALILLGWPLWGCAARGHIATPDEMVQMRAAQGLSASGRLGLAGPQGKFSARVVFGVARPDSLRIEIPSGSGLRFLLVARGGLLRADLPGDDAMFEGPATREIMDRLFGIEVAPRDLVGALLGSPPQSMAVVWRFERARPTQVTIQGSNRTKLTLTLDDPEIESPGARAFAFPPPRAQSWTVNEMSERLGLRR